MIHVYECQHCKKRTAVAQVHKGKVPQRVGCRAGTFDNGCAGSAEFFETIRTTDLSVEWELYDPYSTHPMPVDENAAVAHAFRALVVRKKQAA